jgi:integrase/recombinase XerC
MRTCATSTATTPQLVAAKPAIHPDIDQPGVDSAVSTSNVLCTFLYTAEVIASNPMPLVGRPKLAKTLPNALPTDSVTALLATLNSDPQPRGAATGRSATAP